MTLGRRVLILASALALALGLPSLSRAQSLTGSISGTVADAQGGMLPGADVALTNQDSKTVQRTVTNTEGVFVFASVPAGTYAVRVELSGFTAWEATDIVMLLGQRRTVTGITLKVGGVEEVISVTSRPDIAPVDSGEKSARLTSEQIQNVPMVGRSTGELLKLLPGMTPISAAAPATTRATTAKSSASTATATAASRARSATSRATAPAPTPSTSSSTAPTPPTPAATAPRRSTRTPTWSASSRCCSRTTAPSTPRARSPST